MIELRPYQLEALAQGEKLDGFGLFLQQRMGKTITALVLAQRWGCKQVLVVCPKKALTVWPAELKKLENPDINLTVVTFGMLNSLVESVSKRHTWDCLIVDESHRVKARGTIQTKIVTQVSKRCAKRILLTGTPMGNGYEDYFSQLRIIEPSLYPTWGEFAETHLIFETRMVPGRSDSRGEPLEYSKIVGYKNLDKLSEVLDKYTYRKLRSQVQSSIRKNKYIRLAPEKEFRDQYNHLKNKLFLRIGKDDIITAPLAMTKAMKLHQLCGGTIKTDGGAVELINSPKIDWIDAFLSKVRHPVVIVAKFMAEFDLIEGIAQSHGKTVSRVSGKHKFTGNHSDVVLLQPQSGLAIDLSFCEEMVIYSMDYSYLNWDQFLDRTVTMSKTSARYTYLLIQRSVDIVILDCLKGKSTLESKLNSQDYLQDM